MCHFLTLARLQVLATDALHSQTRGGSHVNYISDQVANHFIEHRECSFFTFISDMFSMPHIKESSLRALFTHT